MKGIPMKTREVQAILDNRKTVVRREVRPQPVCRGPNITFAPHGDSFFLSKEKNWLRCRVCGHDPQYSYKGSDIAHHWAPPYRSGDILYVRETWQEVYETEVDEVAPCGFVNIRERIRNFDEIPKVEAGISRNCATATMEPRMKYYVFKASDISYTESANGLCWRPSIHMPREAARIFLRVTYVLVERLQEINDDGAKAEGANWRNGKNVGLEEKMRRSVIDRFAEIWNNTLKPKDRALYGWEANPWVWVIEFERISKEEVQNEAD